MQRLAVEVPAIPREGMTWRCDCQGAELEVSDREVALARPVAIECQCVTVNHEVVVRGTLRSAVRLTCSRCAEEFVLPLNLVLDAIYLPASAMASEHAEELEQGESDVYFYTEEVIDFTEMIRDRLFLSIPLQPHCKVGCKGLCPSCGVNRNTLSCQCAEERLGSPFELLKGLRFSCERQE